MAFAAATLDTVLTAVVARIVASSSVFSADNAYIALRRPEHWTPFTEESLAVIVYPGSGQFEGDVMGGGGTFQLWWRGTITVEVMSNLRLDEAGREKEFLTNSTYGVIKGVTEVIRALAIHTLQVSGNDVSIDPIFPQSTSPPIQDEGNLGSYAVDFEVSFKWAFS